MEKIVDTVQALEQAGGSEQLAKELFSMLLNELPAHQQAISQAHASGDLEALWDPAHKLYGATAYCGVPALRTAAKKLEDAIRASRWESISECIEGLSRAISELQQHSQALIAKPW